MPKPGSLNWRAARRRVTDAKHRVAAREGTRWVAPIGAIIITAFLAVLLHQLVFRGWAHSYDSAIYVRSLWGIAQRNLTNPWVDLHILSIHANFVLFLLAPFTTVLHPAAVLIGAQSIALGATIGMVAAEVRESALAARMDRHSVLAALAFFGCAVTIGAPMVINPFLFDIRPDLIGIPLITYGLLRARRQGAFDVQALAVMLSALLVREEYMMVIVGAMVAGPMPRKLSEGWRLRAVGIALAVGYWALYWFGFRNWIGDGSYAIAQEVGAAFLDETSLNSSQVVGYKIELIAAFVLSTGGLVAIGWRWIGPALPGFLFLLISSRMQELILNFHYVMFVIPGLLVAGVDGFERWTGRRRNVLALPVISATLIALTFAWSSALPGGGRFRAENFFLFEPDVLERRADVLAAHDLVAQIPADVGIAMPHELAAPVADRALVVSVLDYLEDVSEEGVPDGIDWVILPGARWANAGRIMVDLHGFRLVDFEGSRLALLTRDASVPTNWSAVVAVDNPLSCQTPIAQWPAAGFRLCGIEPRADGRVRITVIRNEEVDQRVGRRPLVLLVRPTGAEAFTPATMLHGLVNPTQLPTGGSGVFVTDVPLVQGPHGELEIVLAFTVGGAIPALLSGAEDSVAGVMVAW